MLTLADCLRANIGHHPAVEMEPGVLHGIPGPIPPSVDWCKTCMEIHMEIMSDLGGLCAKVSTVVYYIMEQIYTIVGWDLFRG